jgi:hypothetical protein
LEAAAHEMDVRVVESGQHELFAGINYPGIRAGQFFDLVICADADDAIAEHRDGLCCRIVLNHRVHIGVDDDQVSGERRPFGVGDEVG